MLADVPQGWCDLVRALAEWIEEIGLPEGDRIELREKWGGLGTRAPVHHGAVHESAAAMEVVSTAVCEICGAPGRLRKDMLGGVKTTCEEHVQ
jgi:hypothetical protein